MKSVLFVCTANRCRSPMAEALLKARVAKLGQAADWQITSAGTWTEPNLPPLPLAQQAMSKRGLNIESHRSQPVDAALLESAGVVLVMTNSHREGLSVEFPKMASKIMLLSRLAGPGFGLRDPAAGSDTEYKACASYLDQILEHGFNNLDQLAQVK